MLVDEATHEAFLRVQEQLPEVIRLCPGKALRRMASTAGNSVGMMMMMVVVVASSRRGQSFNVVEEVLLGGERAGA